MKSMKSMKSQYVFFNGKTVREYKEEINSALTRAIESMSDEEILHGDFDTWIQYFADKFTIQPIVIYFDNIERTMSETKIKVRNQWYPYNGGIEPEFYERNGYKIEYKIPYSGDFHLLSLQPNTMILVNYQVTSFIESSADTAGSFNLCLQFTERELLGKKDDMEVYVTRCFNEKFEDYKSMIGYINQEIGNFNVRLKNEIEDLLNNRKNKAKNKEEICRRLHIPLKTNPNAPDLNPVQLKLIKKTYANPPKIVKPSLEYCITDQDYDNIIKIIHHCCSVMELTTRTSNKYEEEELRDQILAILGTHYQNNTWGETFRRKGKTDILIPFENKAAFIAECKIWHGIKQFEAAIKQLFGYSTWKDIKVAVVVFNKTNRDFLTVIKRLEDWIKENTIKFSKKEKNCWKCIIREEKRNLDFEVTICIYDLSVND